MAAPAEDVWAALIDYESRSRFSPRVREARVLDDGPLQEGSRIRLRIDRDRFTATVVSLRASDTLSLRVQGPGFRVFHSYEVTPRGSATEVSLSADYRGIIGRLVGKFMRGSLRRDVADELAAIQAAAEAERE